ncbi:MAG: HIT domain-containing protein [Planctomycetota bacterium]|nr:HIT domain-containing protein [Planctomycetota bacterium]
MPKHTRKTQRAAKISTKKKRDGLHRRAAVFAPWRLEFVLGPKDSACFLCEAARVPDGDEAAWKKLLLLHRDEHALIIMNRYPYTGGHLLVAPRRHTHELPALSEPESQSFWEQTRLCVDVLGRVMKMQGCNVGMNLGKAAGAGIADHLHMHAIPRWVGDTNFWPVIGGVHTVPVALDKLWDEMRPAFLPR